MTKNFSFLWGWEINKDSYGTEAEMRGSRKDQSLPPLKAYTAFQGQHITFKDILDFSGVKHRNLMSCACQSAIFNQIKWLQSNKLNLKRQEDDSVRREIDLC